MNPTFEKIYSQETLKLVQADPLSAAYTLRAKLRDPVLYQGLYERLAQPLGRVLDIGCGPGRFTLLLAKHTDAAVGLDLSPLMLRLARELEHARAQTNVAWVQGDAHKLPFRAESFETIVSTYALAFTNLPEVFRQINPLLKPGGQALLYITRRPPTKARTFLLNRLKSTKHIMPRMLSTFGVMTTLRFVSLTVNPNRYAHLDPQSAVTSESMQELCARFLPHARLTFQDWTYQVEWTKN